MRTGNIAAKLMFEIDLVNVLKASREQGFPTHVAPKTVPYLMIAEYSGENHDLNR